MTSAVEPKHQRFEYSWSRERWTPQTADLIQSWGDTLAALHQEIGRRSGPRRGVVEQQIQALEKLKRSTTLQTVLRRLEASGEPSAALWQEFGAAVHSCAGIPGCKFENLALCLVKYGFDELALGLVAIEEFIEPNDSGIARLHLEGIMGRRDEAVRALVRIVWEPGRSWASRVRALSCVGELDGEAFEDEAKWLGVAASEEGDTDAAWEIRSLISRYQSPRSRSAC